MSISYTLISVSGRDIVTRKDSVEGKDVVGDVQRNHACFLSQNSRPHP
jgi:hypothetical protein